MSACDGEGSTLHWSLCYNWTASTRTASQLEERKVFFYKTLWPLVLRVLCIPLWVRLWMSMLAYDGNAFLQILHAFSLGLSFGCFTVALKFRKALLGERRVFQIDLIYFFIKMLLLLIASSVSVWVFCTWRTQSATVAKWMFSQRSQDNTLMFSVFSSCCEVVMIESSLDKVEVNQLTSSTRLLFFGRFWCAAFSSEWLSMCLTHAAGTWNFKLQTSHVNGEYVLSTISEPREFSMLSNVSGLTVMISVRLSAICPFPSTSAQSSGSSFIVKKLRASGNCGSFSRSLVWWTEAVKCWPFSECIYLLLFELSRMSADDEGFWFSNILFFFSV